MFRLKKFKIFQSFRNRTLFRMAVVGGIVGVNYATKPDDFTAFK